MKSKILFLSLLFLFLSNSVIAQEPEWFTKIRNVELLKATREDIIKLFGQPDKSKSPYNPSYQLKEGQMDVEYSRGLCGTDNKIGWNVPEFTVTRIFFFTAKVISLKKLGLDVTGFRKYEAEDAPGNFSYENENIGINFGVGRTGKASSFEVYPPSKHDNLRCKD